MALSGQHWAAAPMIWESNHMKAKHLFAATILTLALAGGAVAQTTTKTEVKTGVENGAPTKTVKVTHVHKRKTHHVKKILGVKVGHKTAVSKTVKETKMGPDGTSTTVSTTHK